MFDVDRIARCGLVRHIDYHESLASTSDRALAMAARDDAPLPLLVLTERQTGGRGRGTNRWSSTAGALTFSLVQPAPADLLPPERWPQVALVVGLAVCEALTEFLRGVDCRVKWPNDVFAADRKICGILCESVPGWRDRLAIGVGINVNNSVLETGLSGATAMVDLDGLPRDLTEVLLAVLDRFEFRWSQFTAGGLASLTDDYQARCFLTGKTVAIACGNQRLVGRCGGIDARGALVLHTESGKQTIIAGSVESWDG